MITSSKSKLILGALVVAALLALPAAASATLTYTKFTDGTFKTDVYYAKDNGKSAHKIGLGRNSHVSPNGELVAFERETSSNMPELKLYSIATGKTTTIFASLREGFVFAWSPDSAKIAALRGNFNGPAKLVVAEVETGNVQTVATGYVNGVSFSPESDEVVYGLSKTETYPLKSDLYRYKLRSKAAPLNLSHDKNAAYPLWGPTGQIVFARQLGAKQRQYGPKNELYVMNEEGEQISQLTKTTVSPLAQGLVPTGWSASGKQLLTEFNGEDMSYGVAVNPVTGAQKALTNNPESGFAATAISSDGKTVLGSAGIPFSGTKAQPRVVTVPFKGGKQKVLVKDALEPSWGN